MRINRINEEEEIYIPANPEIDRAAAAQDFIREAVTQYREKQELKRKRTELFKDIRMIVSTACAAVLFGIAVFRLLP